MQATEQAPGGAGGWLGDKSELGSDVEGDGCKNDLWIISTASFAKSEPQVSHKKRSFFDSSIGGAVDV